MKATDLKGVALLRFYSKAKKSLSSVLGSGVVGIFVGFLIGLFLFRFVFLTDELSC